LIILTVWRSHTNNQLPAATISPNRSAASDKTRDGCGC
jgi:hypothetical protein